LTNQKFCAIIITTKGKENPKHQKGNETMFKVTMNGAISSLSVTPDFDEALAILFPALQNPNVSGNIEDTETGEVLVVVENGEVPYIAPDTIFKMLDSIFETDPEGALELVLMGLMAGL
jgi:hypothetical protein